MPTALPGDWPFTKTGLRTWGLVWGVAAVTRPALLDKKYQLKPSELHIIV